MDEKLTLRKIADWQLTNQDEVTLPAMQRGFVWKPDQIEALWDSLLRRFPIGSFLFSKTGEGNYLLMDGQQRATSIALGFFNPFSEKSKTNLWSLKGGSEHLPVVWIDIKPKKDNLPERSKYLLRVVTQSQPWGYSVNHEKLGINERKEALELFKKHPDNKGKGYTQFANTTYFPVAASYPVPLAFFFEVIEQGKTAKNAVVDGVVALCEKHLPPYMQIGTRDKTTLISSLKDKLRGQLEDIAEAVLHICTKSRINYDVLDESVLTASGDATEKEEAANEESEAENPTLFVRVNSGGTTLGGDELIYSLYKAAFPKSKNLVEKIGMGFIAPTQIVSIAARVAYADSHKGEYPARMTVPQFQRLVEQKSFTNKLATLIGSEESSPICGYFETAKKILSLESVDGFKEENNSFMPPVLIKEFIKKSPDLFLLLVYWLSKNSKQELSPDLARRITARLLAFSWFTFDRSKKTVEKTVKALWPSAQDAGFWDNPITNLVTNDPVLLAVPIRPELLHEYYFNRTVENHFFDGKDDCWELLPKAREAIDAFYGKISKKLKDDPDNESFLANDNFQAFVNSLWECRSMVLFAQREYINREFADFNQLDDLDDTNTPWDWDHIYPGSWVYNRKKVPAIIREWNGCIGNLRALALEENRGESDHLSPTERLADEKTRQLSFVADDWQYWEAIDSNIQNDWDKKDILLHYHAVVNRMLNIYQRWWDDLHIWEVVGCKK